MSDKPKAVYTIIEAENLDKAIWRRVGSAFTNRDGSINVLLDALPTNGKLQIREDKDRRSESERA